ncbi:hypothetical protein RRG08_059782 [Elysia crispata]|uniref:Uncharacterized protein n=1 Tax=Elysia crispata TaxID=231223 RepID=A0AAE1BCS6_9GAST|nr:hypothetical protein RRG08_059782 [Elysia crispata]
MTVDLRSRQRSDDGNPESGRLNRRIGEELSTMTSTNKRDDGEKPDGVTVENHGTRLGKKLKPVIDGSVGVLSLEVEYLFPKENIIIKLETLSKWTSQTDVDLDWTCSISTGTVTDAGWTQLYVHLEESLSSQIISSLSDHIYKKL